MNGIQNRESSGHTHPSPFILNLRWRCNNYTRTCNIHLLHRNHFPLFPLEIVRFLFLKFMLQNTLDISQFSYNFYLKISPPFILLIGPVSLLHLVRWCWRNIEEKDQHLDIIVYLSFSFERNMFLSSPGKI